MSCKLSDKCDNVFACNVLRPEVELLGCNFYKPKKPMTNEEWLHTLRLDTKAYWLANTCRKAMWEDKYDNNDEKSTLDYWKEWLKQPRKPKE